MGKLSTEARWGLYLAVLGGVFLYRTKRQKLEELREVEFSRRLADTELKCLLSQLNLHFLFNSLNSITYYISENQKEDAIEYLTKFAGYIRSILEISSGKEVSLEEDLNLMKIYLQLENMRLQQKFRYNILVAQEIDTKNTLVPPLLLQPFIENSIWHGITGIEEGSITISIKKHGDHLRYILEDTGTGRRTASSMSNPGKKSFGIELSRKRLKLITHSRDLKADIKFKALHPGLRVEIRLPLELKFQK